jgi:hypothetical protein
MIDLHDRDSGALITTISEDDLAFLIREMEEEGGDDRDYYIERATLEVLGHAGGNPELLHTLGQALGDREGMEIIWSRRS